MAKWKYLGIDFSPEEKSSYPAAKEAFDSRGIQRKIRWARGALVSSGLPPTTRTAAQRQSFWAAQLYGSVDGFELSSASLCPASTAWIRRPASCIPGRDFIQYVHVLINCLPSRVRVSRGTRRNQRDVQCRAGCPAKETAAHTIQGCWRTHGGRVLRHDAVVRVLSEALTAKGWAVIASPRIQTREGLRRPDIIAGRGQEVALVDAQVVSGAKSLSISHREKSAQYASNPDVQEYAMSTADPRPTRLTFTSCILSWRVVWSAESYQDLCSLGVPTRVLEGITTRVPIPTGGVLTP
ncbi:hypothetical protein CBL_12315 [Carabus blaptoides fortunei]